jgi:hypothetical protein
MSAMRFGIEARHDATSLRVPFFIPLSASGEQWTPSDT